MTKTLTIVKTVSSLMMVTALFSGCSQQEAQLSNSLVNSAIGVTGASRGSVNNLQTLASPAGVGMLQSQVVGAQMLANPAVLGVGAVGTAISEHNKAQNRKAFGQITDMYVNSDKLNSGMEGMMVQAYNKKYGTHYKTMQQIQEMTKIQGWNKKYGTKYTTLGQVRLDYNKRKGTSFKTDKEFRSWLAQHRR